MKAMILAAGLGTRLKPFTDFHPKALFVAEGRTLLEHAILHLKTAGITEVIVNVHHFASQITWFLEKHDNFGLEIAISDETGALLETGGGLKQAGWFFNNCDAAIVIIGSHLPNRYPTPNSRAQSCSGEATSLGRSILLYSERTTQSS